jgi:hypothetical protein
MASGRFNLCHFISPLLGSFLFQIMGIQKKYRSSEWKNGIHDKTSNRARFPSQVLP